MYEDRCPHGYVPGSCAECRAALSAGPGDRGYQLLDHYRSQYAGKTRAELDAARGRCITRAAELESYPRLSRTQAAEMDTLIAEQITIDDLIKADDVEIRRATIARGTALMADPGNLEGPESGTRPDGAPALVKGLGDRHETGAEVIRRMRSNPWRHEDGPVNRADTADGLIARASIALEGLEGTLTREGCQ